MQVLIVFTESVYRCATAHLLQATGEEQFGFFLAGVCRADKDIRLLVREFLPAGRDALAAQSGVRVRPCREFTRQAWQRCRGETSVLLDVHSHPFSDRGVTFSGIDDRADQEAFPMAVRYLGPGPHASMVFGQRSVDARWYDAKTSKVRAVSEIRVLGSHLRRLRPTAYSRLHPDKGLEASADDQTYARQALLFGQQGQRQIQNLKVGIVGAGGLGSIVCLLLARLGVRSLVVVDPDVVEQTNLNRLFGSLPRDAEQAVPKVQMLARRIREFQPRAGIQPIQDTVMAEGVQQRLKGCDVLFGCTDTTSSRVVLNRLSAQYLIPLFDTGTGIVAEGSGEIQHAGGQVRVIVPGMGCLHCIRGLDPHTARQETLSPTMRQLAVQRGYVSGVNVPDPAVASLNTAIASLAVTEFMAFVTRVKPLCRYVFYDFVNSAVKTIRFRKDENCLVCSSAGVLACGDQGTRAEIAPVSPAPLKSQGVEKMNDNHATIGKQIEQLTTNLKQRDFRAEGDPSGQWFLVSGLRLGKAWNAATADVMVKLPPGGAGPVVLIPDHLALNLKAACPRFLADHSYLKGWRRLCPHQIEGLENHLLEFLVCLAGLLAAPELCGVGGCEVIDGKG